MITTSIGPRCKPIQWWQWSCYLPALHRDNSYTYNNNNNYNNSAWRKNTITTTATHSCMQWKSIKRIKWMSCGAATAWQGDKQADKQTAIENSTTAMGATAEWERHRADNDDRRQRDRRQTTTVKEPSGREFLIVVVVVQIKTKRLLRRAFVVIARFKYKRIATSVVVAFIYCNVCLSWHHRHHTLAHSYIHTHITAAQKVCATQRADSILIRPTAGATHDARDSLTLFAAQKATTTTACVFLCCICCTNIDMYVCNALFAISIEMRLYVYLYLPLRQLKGDCEIITLSFILFCFALSKMLQLQHKHAVFVFESCI